MYWGKMVPVEPIKRFSGIAALVQAHAYEMQLKEVGKVMSEAYKCDYCKTLHDISGNQRKPNFVVDHIWHPDIKKTICPKCEERLNHMNDKAVASEGYPQYVRHCMEHRIQPGVGVTPAVFEDDTTDWIQLAYFTAGALVGAVAAVLVVTFL